MKRITFICLTLLLSIIYSYAQKATICFKTDMECLVSIYEPIDGAYNNRVATHELALLPNASKCHKVNIETFGIVYLRFSQYQKKCKVFLFPNDYIQISISNQGITFKGNNESGQQFFYDSFTSRPFADNFQKMKDIVQEYTNHVREIKSVIPTIYNQQMLPYLKKVEELTRSSNITLAFSNVLKREINFRFVPYIISLFNTTLSRKDEHYMTTSDRQIMKGQIDSLSHLYDINKEIMKYDSRVYIIRYLNEYSKNNNRPDSVTEKIFGPYKNYLLAPIEMHPDLLGNACIIQLQYDTKEMELFGVREYLNTKFPNHPYTAIVNKQIESIFAEHDKEDFSPVLIKEDIDSLSTLVKVQELKGKYLFIDLWASWCIPCRKEFNYQKQLHEILSQFTGIASVYISIDKQQKGAWEGCINRYQLNGFHLLASEALVKDIQKEIYGTDKMEIPRYVLIAPSGKILHKDLPRPSNYPQLKATLKNVIKP